MEQDKAAVQSAATRRPGCAGWLVRGGRLRSGWRVVLYVIASRLADVLGAIAIGIVLAMTIGVALSREGVPSSEIAARISEMFSDLGAHPLLALGAEAERVVSVLVIVFLFRRLIDRRSFRSLGFEMTPGWWQEALGGLVFVLLAWGVIFILSLGLGGAVVVGSFAAGNWPGALGGLAFGLGLNILVGLAEETDARGYVLQNLAEGIRFWPALLLSSLYFAVLHLLNPGAGAGSTVGILFAGLVLGMGYYATGRLWFPIGMHAGWNFTEGPVFGFLVSGLNMGGLVQLKITGPEWLMGGAFGPEAGALAIIVEIVMIVLLFVWGRTRASRPMARQESARVGSPGT